MSAEDNNNGLNFGLLPLALSVAGFIVSLTLEFLLPLAFLPAFLSPGWQIVVGPSLVALGIALMVWAMMTLRRAGTTFNPSEPTTKMVASGPFGFSRNPMYLTLLIFQAGIATSFSLEWGLVLLPVVCLALDRLVIVSEERYLASRFGKDFEDYRAKVRRWI